METRIEIKIPYLPNKRLGEAYNKGMESAYTNWVLFLDHDVMILNHRWYDTLIKVINILESNKIKAGWITAVTNRISCVQQKAAVKDPGSNDIYYHIKEAKRIYKNNKGKLIKADPNRPFSGFFILTNKYAWETVGGFNEPIGEFGHVDNDYYFKLVSHGFKQFIVPEIYCYHIWKKDKLKIFNW